MEKVITDGNLEQIIHDLRVEDPKLKCRGGRIVSRMCTNSSCKYSLICDNCSCQFCGEKVHPTCSSVPLSRVTSLLNKQTQLYKELVWDVLAIDEQLIESIKQGRKQLAEYYKAGHLQPKYQKLIDQIYMKKNPLKLTGREAADLCEMLKVIYDSSKEKKEVALKKYKEHEQQVVEQIKGYKKDILDRFSKEHFLKIKSNIIREQNQLTFQQLQFINKALDTPKQLKLIFRASENGFRAADFHRVCDGIPDTLTLVRTQYGKTIGAFTHYPWVSENMVVKDPAKRACLLSIDRREKMQALSEDNLIVCSVTYGPTFGKNGQSDLYVADKCNNNRNSFAYFPTSYNNKERTYPLSQSSFEMISGAKDQCVFRVLQYEVFHVIYDKDESVKDKGNLYQYHKPIKV